MILGQFEESGALLWIECYQELEAILQLAIILAIYYCIKTTTNLAVQNNTRLSQHSVGQDSRHSLDGFSAVTFFTGLYSSHQLGLWSHLKAQWRQDPFPCLW